MTISLTYSVYILQACEARGMVTALLLLERNLAICTAPSEIFLFRCSCSACCISPNSFTSYVLPSLRLIIRFSSHSSSTFRVLDTLPLIVSRMWLSSFTALITSWM